MKSQPISKIALVTLFPEVLKSFAALGVTGRAVDEGHVQVAAFDPRDYAQDKHRSVDDRPYGGGPGMVMQCGPLVDCITAAKAWVGDARVVYLSPQGKALKQARVNALAYEQGLVLVAGRYEGLDQRVIDNYVDEEISVGDYVLSGGELPALVLMDAILRQVPGVLGKAESAEQDSFSEGLLDCPHYTRPEEYKGLPVPAVLSSGDHKKIEHWRAKQAVQKTGEFRPDLLLEHWINRHD